MRIKSFLIVILFLFFSIVSSAQLGIFTHSNGDQILYFPDTITEGGSSGSYGVTIKNYSTNVFANYVTLNVYLDTNGTSTPSILLDSITTSLLILNPNDTATIFLPPITVTSPPFRMGGGNVLVVWPSATYWTTLDTANKEVVVLPALLAQQFSNCEYKSIAPNPVSISKWMYIDTPIICQRFQLFNQEGKCVYFEKGLIKEINLQKIGKPGIYYAFFEMNERKVFSKIILVE